MCVSTCVDGQQGSEKRSNSSSAPEIVELGTSDERKFGHKKVERTKVSKIGRPPPGLGDGAVRKKR